MVGYNGILFQDVESATQKSGALGYRRKTSGTNIKVLGTVKRPQPWGIAVRPQGLKKKGRQIV